MIENKNQKQRLPSWARLYLYFFCMADLREELEGDILDNFNWRIQNESEWKAQLFLIWDVLTAARFVKSRVGGLPKVMLIQSFAKTSLRSISKSKLSSIISVLSLLIGLTFSLIVLSYTGGQKNWDSYIEDKSDKYRMTFEMYGVDGVRSRSATSPAPYAPHFAERIAGIEEYIRFVRVEDCLITNVGTSSVSSDDVAFGDSGILDFFNIPMLHGDDILNNEKSVLISESLAISLFGTADAMDKMLEFNEIETFQVKGVFSDFPKNSTVSFDLLGPIDFMQTLSPLYYRDGENWGGYAFHTYFQLVEDADIHKIEEDFWRIYCDRFEVDPDDLPTEYSRFGLMNVQDIHLYSELGREWAPPSNYQKLQLLEYLAYLIMLIGWINFMNIQTAHAPERFKEIGIRRSLGAFGRDLRIMFAVEFFIINIVGFVLALGLAQWIPGLLPADTLGEKGTLGTVFTTPILLFILMGMLISSLYPAIQITLKSSSAAIIKSKKSDDFLRNVLVITQFTVTIFVMVYSLIINLQVKFMNQQDPGYDSHQILVVEGPLSQSETVGQRMERYKEQVRKLAGIEYVSSAGIAPGVNKGWQGNLPSYDGENSRFQTSYLSNISDDFFEVFDLQTIAGSITATGSTSPEHPRVVINEQAAGGFGWDMAEAIGKKVGYTDTAVVVGVVENFQMVGFQEDVSPMIFIIDHVYHANTVNEYALIRFDGIIDSNTLGEMEELYQTIFPTNPFEYEFSDKLFERNYQDEVAYNRIFTFFSLLSIIISLMGLIGLTIYHTLQRRKEIGIRKVLGSGEPAVIYLFIYKYALLLLIAATIATPITIVFVQKWLQDFANRIDLDAAVVVAPVGIVFLLSLFTVGVIAMRAAKLNPIDVLKEE